MSIRDSRVCFVGDSFVAGVGDPAHLGWVGRVAIRSADRGVPFTAYNLGIRMDTSNDIRARWLDEVRRRFPAGADNRLVMSFGVNDTTTAPGGTRVTAEESSSNLAAVLDAAALSRWPVLMVGPPPVVDAGQNLRISVLNERFAEICTQSGVPYVDTFGALATEPAWTTEVAAGDGYHPAAEGYERLADAVFPAWWSWISPASAEEAPAGDRLTNLGR